MSMMGNKVPTDQALSRLLVLRKRYRDDVASRKFTAFPDDPGLFRIDGLKAMLPRLGEPGRVHGVIQQASDLIMATKRAVDMRKLSFRDHARRYMEARRFQDAYEARRLQRFESFLL